MSIDLLERYVGFACAATLFTRGAGDGNRTSTVSLGRVPILPCFRVLQRYWRPQLAFGDPYRPGLVARVWPGSLGSRVENRAPAQSSLAEDHRDLTECLTTEDVRRPLSPFDARVPVITAGRARRGDVPSRFRRRRPALGTNCGGSFIGNCVEACTGLTHSGSGSRGATGVGSAQLSVEVR